MRGLNICCSEGRSFLKPKRARAYPASYPVDPASRHAQVLGNRRAVQSLLYRMYRSPGICMLSATNSMLKHHGRASQWRTGQPDGAVAATQRVVATATQLSGPSTGYECVAHRLGRVHWSSAVGFEDLRHPVWLGQCGGASGGAPGGAPAACHMCAQARTHSRALRNYVFVLLVEARHLAEASSLTPA